MLVFIFEVKICAVAVVIQHAIEIVVPAIIREQLNDFAFNSKGTLPEQMDDAVILINYIILEFIGIVLMQKYIYSIRLMRFKPISIDNVKLKSSK